MQEPEDIDAYRDACTTICSEDIEAEYIRLPSDLSYWSNRHASVLLHWLEKKMETKATLASLSEQWRENLAAVAAPKARITVSQVEKSVDQDPNYLSAKRKEIVAEAEKVRLSGIIDAIKAKKEMLISLGAHIRQERDQDPVIREQSRG